MNPSSRVWSWLRGQGGDAGEFTPPMGPPPPGALLMQWSDGTAMEWFSGEDMDWHAGGDDTVFRMEDFARRDQTVTEAFALMRRGDNDDFLYLNGSTRGDDTGEMVLRRFATRRRPADQRDSAAVRQRRTTPPQFDRQRIQYVAVASGFR